MQSILSGGQEVNNYTLGLQQYIAHVELQTGKWIKTIQVNGGGEFEGPWLDFCKERGIIIKVIAPYLSAANGVAERAISITIARICTMIHSAGLKPKMWAETAATDVYLQSLVPSLRNPGKMPYEWYKKKHPDVSHLRVFGCDAYMKTPVIHRKGKLDDRSENLTLIGYYG